MEETQNTEDAVEMRYDHLYKSNFIPNTFL